MRLHPLAVVAMLVGGSSAIGAGIALHDGGAKPVLPSIAGAYNPAVKQATLGRTVCRPGYSSSIRPPVSYTARVKRELLNGRRARDFQLDHLISLSVGGAPRARQNLWLQPQKQARRDDEREWGWHRDVCAGELTLRQAQRAELAYKRKNG